MYNTKSHETILECVGDTNNRDFSLLHSPSLYFGQTSFSWAVYIALYHRRKNPANLPGFSKITRQNTAVQKNPANKTRQNTTDDNKNQVAPQGENLSFYFMFLTFYVQKCLGNDHKILSARLKIKKKIACGALDDENRWKFLKEHQNFPGKIWKKSPKTRQNI